MTNGVRIYDNLSKKTLTINVLSENYENNEFQLIRQIEIVNSSSLKTRIPDVVLYINGLPFVVMELKAILAKETLKDA
ncbi:MAG: hypothetical protein LBF97_05800 [Elusimicrobiota bacterium]|nr:hypothetical protein [Elusimicrobiota bacterium]